MNDIVSQNEMYWLVPKCTCLSSIVLLNIVEYVTVEQYIMLLTSCVCCWALSSLRDNSLANHTIKQEDCEGTTLMTLDRPVMLHAGGKNCKVM